MSKLLVLYQCYPGRKHTFHHTTEMFSPTVCVDSFSCDKKGIDAAIEKAERKDALVVILDKLEYDSESLLKAVEKKIKQKKFKYLFKPAEVEEVEDA